MNAGTWSYYVGRARDVEKAEYIAHRNSKGGEA